MPHFPIGAIETIFEGSVEILEHLSPIGMLFLDVVQLLFHITGVANLEDLRECLDQFIGNDLAQIGCVEEVLDFFHVLSSLNNLDNLSVGAGPANPFGFELLNQRGLGVPRRR